MHSEALEAQVRRVADGKATDLGFDPDECDPQLRKELRPDDETFLDEEDIGERESLWAVYYAPDSGGFHQGGQEAQAGGDLTVYVHVESHNVVAVWLGE